MPLYDFTCKKCENIFEDFLTIKHSREDLPKCPKCGSQDVERRIGPVALHGVN